jgi:hypothetical protein
VSGVGLGLGLMLHAVTLRAPAKPRTVIATILLNHPFRVLVVPACGMSCEPAVIPVLVSMVCSLSDGRIFVPPCTDRLPGPLAGPAGAALPLLPPPAGWAEMPIVTSLVPDVV